MLEVRSYDCIIPVLNIVLMYVEPRYLIKFFAVHGFKLDLKFVYDMFNYDLMLVEIECIFMNFPNIVVIGMSVYDVDDSLDRLPFSVHSLRRVKLVGKVFGCDDEYYDRWDFDDNHIDVLRECKSIVYFEIMDSYVNSLNFLNRCLGLKTLKVSDCNCIEEISGFVNLWSLNVARCKELRLVCGEKLKYLGMANCNGMCAIRCENLMCLEVKRCSRIVDVNVVKELDCLVVLGVMDVSLVRNLDRIKHVYVNECNERKKIVVGGGDVIRSVLDYRKYRRKRT